MDNRLNAGEKWQKGRKWSTRRIHSCKANNSVGRFHPRHIILATGHSGEPHFPADIAGIKDFQGDRLIHSAYFTLPNKIGKGKKAIVVGCCNSGHDIARNDYDYGYDVTII